MFIAFKHSDISIRHIAIHSDEKKAYNYDTEAFRFTTTIYLKKGGYQQ